MGQIVDKDPVPLDDPTFSGRVEFFVVNRSDQNVRRCSTPELPYRTDYKTDRDYSKALAQWQMAIDWEKFDPDGPIGEFGLCIFEARTRIVDDPNDLIKDRVWRRAFTTLSLGKRAAREAASLPSLEKMARAQFEQN
jgi:hypothetical protein